MRMPLIWFLLLLCTLSNPYPAFAETSSIRFATFNIAMGLETEGELLTRLKTGEDENLRKVAAVIQQVRPDVLLLNEFDYLPDSNAASMFLQNYLTKPQFGGKPISYAYSFDGAVNTGINSGLDLDKNGDTGDPADAWGFGHFPGQYGMQVFSRFPLDKKAVRSFRQFLWVDMPGALQPLNADGTSWYSAEVRQQLRLSSKNHWDIPVEVDGKVIHFLVSHPTPPVFDGPEDRNGTRNHDEIRLWADFIKTPDSGYLYDDNGTTGSLPEGALFVIAGDLNADPVDGDSTSNAIGQLLDHPLVDASCIPQSSGAVESSIAGAGKNLEHKGDPAADTGDFNDQWVGNMRIDYALPSATLHITGCGVYWPASTQPGHKLTNVSDHHLVWVDVHP